MFKALPLNRKVRRKKSTRNIIVFFKRISFFNFANGSPTVWLLCDYLMWNFDFFDYIRVFFPSSFFTLVKSIHLWIDALCSTTHLCRRLPSVCDPWFHSHLFPKLFDLTDYRSGHIGYICFIVYFRQSSSSCVRKYRSNFPAHTRLLTFSFFPRFPIRRKRFQGLSSVIWMIYY